MGLPKWDHIKALVSDPDIAARWQRAHGAAPTDRDVDRVYEVFVPLNTRVVTDYADLIPGTVETVADARRRGLKIGSTTGYTREIMEPLLPLARAQGYAPDNLVCAGDLAAGRPTPLMMYKCFADLGVWPAAGGGEGRRHGSGHRRGTRGRLLDGRRGHVGQCARAVARTR